MDEDVELKEKEQESIIRSLNKLYKIEPKYFLILDEREIRLANLGILLKLYKIVNTNTGESLRVALDEKNSPVNYDEILKKEHSLEYEKYGNLQFELYRLTQFEKRTLPVLIKIAIPEKLVDKSERELEEIREEAIESERNIELQAAKMYRSLMRELNLQVPKRISPSGPFISVILPTEVILKLSKDKRIAFIGLDQEKVVKDYPTIARVFANNTN